MKNLTITAATLIALIAGLFSTMEESQAQIRIGGGGIIIDLPGICPKPGPGPGPIEPPPKPVRYRVTLKHPRTGGVIYSRTVNSRSQASSLMTTWQRYHWKVYKRNGVGEQERSKMFTSYSAASRYKLPFHILGYKYQYIKAGRVTMQRL